MGTEALWIPAVISAIGAGASAYQTHQVAKDQDQAAAQGIRTQQAKQREIDARASQEIDALEQSSPEDERAAAMEKYMTQLRTARGNMEGDGNIPNASDRYQKDVVASKAGIGNFGEKVADILSRVQAAGDQRRNEGYSFGRAGSDIAGTAREAQGADFLNRLRISGIQRNPWVDAGSNVLQGVAQGMSAKYASGAGPGPKPGWGGTGAGGGVPPPMGGNGPWGTPPYVPPRMNG
jgi:hypothetical protein